MRTSWLIPAMVVLLLVAGGCRYQRVVKYEPMLSGLPGAQVGTDVTTKGAKKSVQGKGEVLDAEKQTLRIEHEDGTVILVSKTGRQLMAHIYTTLANNEPELFVDQVLSEISKKEFAERGVDPLEGFKYLQQHQDVIRKLFNAMPMGEFTPGVFMKAQGDNVFRLELTGLGKRGLTWTFMDMVFEHGGWRLRWFG
ncbi:MAG: hypothetical protein R3B57_08850 [Phycisphaerales bacterium]